MLALVTSYSWCGIAGSPRSLSPSGRKAVSSTSTMPYVISMHGRYVLRGRACNVFLHLPLPIRGFLQSSSPYVKTRGARRPVQTHHHSNNSRGYVTHSTPNSLTQRDHLVDKFPGAVCAAPRNRRNSAANQRYQRGHDQVSGWVRTPQITQYPSRISSYLHINDLIV